MPKEAKTKRTAKTTRVEKKKKGTLSPIIQLIDAGD
jgi:hypothetical protein